MQIQRSVPNTISVIPNHKKVFNKLEYENKELFEQAVHNYINSIILNNNNVIPQIAVSPDKNCLTVKLESIEHNFKYEEGKIGTSNEAIKLISSTSKNAEKRKEYEIEER